MLRSEKEIIASWKHGVQRPLLTICCIAFNHEKFIDDALRGFLIQETDFPVEILVHDDASADRTADIIHDYQARYPRLIKVVAQTENQFSKGNRGRNFLKPLVQGKYIAWCEGDDYWTDPKKLQIQVDFLARCPEYVISGHDACIVNEKGEKTSESKLPDQYKHDQTADELMLGNAPILTLTWVYRNVIENDPAEFRNVVNGDTFYTSLLGAHGKAKYHSDIKPACYRIHDGGIWSSLDQLNRKDSLINTYFWMYRYYRRIGIEKAESHFKRLHTKQVLYRTPLRLLVRELCRRVLQALAFKPIGNCVNFLKRTRRAYR